MADVHELLDTWIANVKDEELLAELNTMKEQGDEDAITSMRPSSIRRSPSLAIAAIKVSCSSRRRLPFLQQTA